MVNEEQSLIDEQICSLVAWLMVIPLATNFLGAISRIVFDSTLLSTVVIYAVFLCFLVKQLFISRILQQYRQNVFVTWLLTLIVVGINYFVFNKTRVYYSANIEQLLVIFLFFLPVASIERYVEDWTYFFEKGKICVWLTPIVGFVGIRFLSFNEFLSYMHIGVALLPGVLLAWFLFRIASKKIMLLPFILSLLELTLYGNKMSVLSVVIFIFLIEFIRLKNGRSSIGKYLLVFVFLIIGIILIINYESVLSSIALWLESFGFESRVLQKFATKTAFIDNSRDIIYSAAQQGLRDLGLSINGLFGDRIVLRNYIGGVGYTSDYVHNIFYELILSFGWIIGGTLIIVILISTAKEILLSTSKKDYFVAFMFCYIFLRLIVSSSFLVEGPFWLLIGVLLTSKTSKIRIIFHK